MIADIDDQTFDKLVEHASGPVLIEFWQPGCGHCQALLKELECIQQECRTHLLIFKMNVQENFLIPAELDIQSLPALALYVDGKFEKFIGGIAKKNKLLEQLADCLERPP